MAVALPTSLASIILPITAVAPIEAAGGPLDVAVVFLAQHSLAPSWPYHRTPWSPAICRRWTLTGVSQSEATAT